MPSQARSRRTAASDSRVDRAASVSSMRRMSFPPVFLAYSQLKSAVRAPPTCRLPVGEGANRTRGGPVRGAGVVVAEEATSTAAAARTWSQELLLLFWEREREREKGWGLSFFLDQVGRASERSGGARGVALSLALFPSDTQTATPRLIPTPPPRARWPQSLAHTPFPAG
jgi:hypothetical protein